MHYPCMRHAFWHLPTHGHSIGSGVKANFGENFRLIVIVTFQVEGDQKFMS